MLNKYYIIIKLNILLVLDYKEHVPISCKLAVSIDMSIYLFI